MCTVNAFTGKIEGSILTIFFLVALVSVMVLCIGTAAAVGYYVGKKKVEAEKEVVPEAKAEEEIVGKPTLTF